MKQKLCWKVYKKQQGLNLPETILKSSALTVSDKKCKKAIELMLTGLPSFIQSPEDIISLKKLSKNISIIAKLKNLGL